MSESTFPFDAPVGQSPVEDEPGGDRKKLAIAGGVAFGLALFAGGFMALGGGGGDAGETFSSVSPRSSTSVAATPAKPAHVVVPEESDDQPGRNPFKARYVAPTASAAGPAGEAPAGTTTGATSGPTDSTTGTTDAAGTTSAASVTVADALSKAASSLTKPAEASTTDSGTAPVEQPKQAPKLIELTTVNTELNQLTFRVVSRDEAATEPFEDIIVKPGEVFATYFKLFGYGSLKDATGQPRNCADLLYGDARLKLCEGETYQAS